jgi:hypothetical protein
MDLAMLVIGVLGLIAASLAAWFAYPAWKAYRAKPNLRLMILPGPRTSAQFYVRLVNEGDGAAVDWIAQIIMPRDRRFMPRDFPLDGWDDREVPAGWAGTWMSRGADDSIGPGLHREFLASPVGEGTDSLTEGTYWIRRPA